MERIALIVSNAYYNYLRHPSPLITSNHTSFWESAIILKNDKRGLVTSLGFTLIAVGITLITLLQTFF